MKFNLCHIVAPPVHGLLGYSEIMESLQWGLSELGHETTRTQNVAVPDRTNILFGIQMFSAEELWQLPDDTIIYNLEQLCGWELSELLDVYPAAAERFRIWDYSADNIGVWEKLRPRYKPIHVPIGWAPPLKRIPSYGTPGQFIDVLIYGVAADSRLQVFQELTKRWVKTVYVCGLYGAARDELIARSRIVLNVTAFPQKAVFELVRVSYLLGNGKAVVSDAFPHYQIADDLRRAVAFSPPSQIVETCVGLLENESERARLESEGPRAMAARDIRVILETVLAAHAANG